MKFNCKICGNCCRQVKRILENKDNLTGAAKVAAENFPFKYKEDGSCEKLVNNKCNCYSKRPLLCNIEKMWKIFYSNIMAKEEYFKRTKLACKELELWIR